MPLKSKSKHLRPVLILVLILFVPGAGVKAQDCSLLPDPVAHFLSQPSLLTRTIDHDQPGVANPAAPMVAPFCFWGEARIRPIWQTLTSAEYTNATLGLNLDLKRDLGFVERGVVLEAMGRFQFSRFSGRIHYEANLNAIKGDFGYFDWPDMRYGGDVDLLCNKGLRFGLNVDMNRFETFFAFGLPDGTSAAVKGGMPLTMGVHFAYNPTGYTGLSSSFESRVRWPIGTGAKITEAEITAGIKSATTLVGTSAVRGGWRYMQIKFGENGQDIDIKTSGFYIDYTFFY